MLRTRASAFVTEPGIANKTISTSAKDAFKDSTEKKLLASYTPEKDKILQSDKEEIAQGEQDASKDFANPDEPEKHPMALWALKFAVPIKNILSCYVLGPVILGECRSERLCLPW